MLVRGIAERTVVRIVRGYDPNHPPVLHQTVELLHRADYIVHMLDDVNRAEMIERSVGERIRESIQIADYVRGARRIRIDADRTRIFADTATDVQRHFGLKMPAHSRESPGERADKELAVLGRTLEMKRFFPSKNFHMAYPP